MKQPLIRFTPKPSNWNNWTLEECFTEQLSDGSKITVPKGMEFDLTSIPRPFWAIFPPFGKYLAAATIHDYLYIKRFREDELGRKAARAFADYQLYFIAKKYGVKSWIAKGFMKTVYIFGRKQWLDNK